jgi:hypothetical protein
MKRSLFSSLGLALATALLACVALPAAASVPDVAAAASAAVPSLAGAAVAGAQAASAALQTAVAAAEVVAVSMRAKFVVTAVDVRRHEGQTTGEQVSFNAVAKSGGYPPDGSDDDNSFARWSPSASCSIHIANPALFGKFERGQKFYVDFTPAS